MIQVNLNISRDVLENVFVTALEGGSNYWYGLPSHSVAAVKKLTDKSDPLSIRVFKFIFDHKGTLEVFDEDIKQCIGILSYHTVAERLQKMANESYCPSLMEEILESGDATTSDVVFQYLCLGEVVYG